MFTLFLTYGEIFFSEYKTLKKCPRFSGKQLSGWWQDYHIQLTGIILTLTHTYFVHQQVCLFAVNSKQLFVLRETSEKSNFCLCTLYLSLECSQIYSLILKELSLIKLHLFVFLFKLTKLYIQNENHHEAESQENLCFALTCFYVSYTYDQKNL